MISGTPVLNTTTSFTLGTFGDIVNIDPNFPTNQGFYAEFEEPNPVITNALDGVGSIHMELYNSSTSFYPFVFFQNGNVSFWADGVNLVSIAASASRLIQIYWDGETIQFFAGGTLRASRVITTSLSTMSTWTFRGRQSNATLAQPRTIRGLRAYQSGAKGGTGWTGPSGVMGPSGLTGPTGPSGFTGQTGQQGPTGLTGSTGPTFSGGTLTSLTMTGPAYLQQFSEAISSQTGATGVVTHDWNTSAIFYHSTMAANFTANITNLPTAAQRSYVLTLLLNQGANPYYASALQIAGSAQTINWANGATPVPLANKKEIETFTVVNTSQTVTPSWLVFGDYGTYG